MGERRSLALLLCSLTVVCVIGARLPQGVFGDQAIQLRAVRQFVDGVSPSINRVTQPDPEDLSRDRAVWQSWWPPATQVAVWPWLALGLSLGVAVRIVAVCALIAGSIGWLRWFERFELPDTVRYAVGVALPFLHEASNSLSVFSQDTLNFAVTPYLLSMTADLLAAPRSTSRWSVAGFILGATYVIKYSLLLVGLGGLLALATQRQWKNLAAAAVAAAVPVVTLSILNAHLGAAANGLFAGAGVYFKPRALLALVADPALAVGDADSLIAHVVQTDVAPLLVGLIPGGLFFWLVIRGFRAQESRESLVAVVVLGTTLVLLAGIWTFSERAADFSARHAAPASLAVVPVAYCGARTARQWWPRIVAMVGMVMVVILPCLYGAVAFGWKAMHPSRPGPSGILNLALDSRVESQIVKAYEEATDVWVAFDSVTALDLPGRVFTGVDPSSFPESFRSSRPLRITALLPPKFESETRRKFDGAGAWERTDVPGTTYQIWTTVLRAMPDVRP